MGGVSCGEHGQTSPGTDLAHLRSNNGGEGFLRNGLFLTNPSIRPGKSRIRPEQAHIIPEKTAGDKVGFLPTKSPLWTRSPSGNQVDGLPLDIHSKPRVLPACGRGARTPDIL